MQQLLTMIHVLISAAIIGLVLIQHGKGADMGAGFGSGASQTMFGSAGSTPFLVKVTGMLAAAFFVNCLLLTYVVTLDVKKTNTIDLTNPVTTSVVPTTINAPVKPVVKEPAANDVAAPVSSTSAPASAPSVAPSSAPASAVDSSTKQETRAKQ